MDERYSTQQFCRRQLEKVVRLRKLPSIDLLRSFDAAARHLSFTKAGDELFITQSAVSRQLKSLEETLGVALFFREIRKLRLTEAGYRLHQTVDSVLKQLEATIDTLSAADHLRNIGISTTVSFAALWLIPRLGSFRASHPHINVRVSATSEVQDIKRQRLDIAIRYARPEMISANARVLFQEEVFAVCSPALLSDPTKPLQEPADLEKHLLLHMDDACGDMPWYTWSSWLQTIGLPQLLPAGVLRCSQYDQVIQAAIDGHGIALGRFPLIARLISKGSLVAPFNEKSLASGAYYLVTESDTESNPDVIDFTNWLFEEIAAEARIQSKHPAARPGAAITQG